MNFNYIHRFAYLTKTLLTLILALLISEVAFAQLSGYQYRKKFSVDNTKVSGASNLTNFPVLISLTDADMATVANGGKVTSAQGYDIAFTSDDGATQLDHELESYNASTGQILFWVRFPTLNATVDTDFFIYFGNASQTTDQSVNTTWDSSYKLVLHLDDFNDATLEGNNGTNNGTTSTAGKIGNARQFSSAGNDFISIADDASLDITGDITFSAWFNVNNFADVPDLITKGDYNQAYSSWIRNDGTLRLGTDNNTLTSTGTVTSATTAFVTFTKSATGRTIYINNTNAGSDGTATNFSTNNSPLTISTAAYPLNGWVDEVRVSNVARSQDWVFTEYENQNTPNTFYTENPENPVLANIESNALSFNAGGSAQFITSDITISTPFADSIESATVQITGNYLSTEDVLAFSNTALITGTWTVGTGTMTLTGKASLADYQSALRSITYNNTNASTPSQAARTISFTVNDEFYASNTATRNVNITTTLTDLSTDFPNTVFHFDAQDIDGDLLTNDQPADGSLVSAWGDRSQNAGGSSVTIANAAPAGDEPIFDSNYFGERGGLYFNYNANNNGDNFQVDDDALINTNGPYTQKSFAAVFRTGTDLTGLQIIYEQGGGSKGYQISIKDGILYAYAWSNDASWTDGDDQSINLGSVSTNTSYIVIATHDATAQTWSARVNGGSLVQSAGIAPSMGNHNGDPTIGEEDGTSDPVNFNNPGGPTYNFDGYIGELISWNSSLNGGQAQSIYNFLCDKWCNTPSVLSSIEGSDIDYNEADPPTAITSTIVLTDVDNTVVDSAHVVISNNYVPSEDVLASTPAGGIISTWDAGTGTLRLTGTASLADYQSTLRSVTYENTDGVAPTVQLRQIDFKVFDWDDESNTQSRNINVIGNNSPPVLSGVSGPAFTYTEGTGAVSPPITVTITDDDDTNIESATIVISNNYQLGEDVLGFTDTANITGSWNSTTGVLTLTGSDTKANYETAIESFTFENTSSDPVEVTRTFSAKVNDGDNDSNTQTRDLDFVAVNSKPVLSNIEGTNLSYPNEAVQITNTIEVSDPDNTMIDSAFVVISGNFKPTEDSLIYSTLFGISGNYNTANGRLKLTGTSSFSDYETALRSVKYKNFATIPAGPERVVSFIIHDGDLASDTLKRTLDVSAVEAISDLKVWLRSDVGVVTSGSEVVTWQDQSGNGNDYTGISGSGTRPTLNASSAPLGGQPSIEFVGNGDSFEDADGHTNYLNSMTEFTLFVVYKSDVTNTDKGLFIGDTPSGADEIITIRYDAAGANNGGSFTNVVKTGVVANGAANQLESFSDIQSTDAQITSLHWESGATYDIFVDGILNNPSSAGPPPTGTITTATTAILGKGGKDTGNNSWDGQIAEFILYCKSLTDAEREKVEDYLSEKYNAAIRKITPAAGGEAISADDANTTYTSLTGPVIQEGLPGELNASGTLILKAPTGYEWNTSGTYNVTEAPAYGGSTTLDASFTSVTATDLTYTIDVASASNPGQLTFTGLEIRPTTGVLPNTGNITNIGSTGQGGGTNYGTLTMIPGTVDSLTFVQQPTITNIDSVITPSVRVQLVDQFGNEVETSGTTVSIAKASGAGTLGGTTSMSTNALGIAEFNDLTLDNTGTHTLITTSTGLNSETSNSFEIVNAGVLVGFRVERSPSGNISSKTAGQSFNTVITAIDGTGNTITTFNGTVVMSSSCTMGVGQGTTANFTSGVLSSHTVSITSVGNCTLTATNSSGSENGTSNSFTVSAGAADATKSKITAAPTVILNDGASTSTITVQLKDAYGNNLTTGGATVTLSPTAGSMGTVTDNGNGTYSATLTSSTSVTTSTITGTVGGSAITDNATVEFAAFSHIWESQLGAPATATNWEDGDNWNSNTVPTATSVVLIPASPAEGNEFPVVDITNTTINTLSIEAGAQVSVSGSVNFVVTGDVTGGGNVLGSNNDSLTVGGNLDVPDVTLGNLIFDGSSDQTIVSPSTFVNVEVDNPGTVFTTDDFTVTGTLSLTDGELFIPSGNNLIANTKTYGTGTLRFQREISGVRGWRILSSPVASTYGDFLDGTVTQGYSGAFYSTGSMPGDTLQPNVLTYIESYPGTDNQRYRAPTSSAQSLTQGQGVFVFFFGDIAADSRYNEPLPDTLDVSGQEFDGNGTQVDFGITYTTAADSGWNLIGNPFGATIDWDDNTNWTKTNVESTIYVWDPAANAGNGEYLTWNGTTGTLGNGLIAPFQGFWVKANANSPSLIVNKDVKTTGGNFIRKQNARTEPVLQLEAITDGLSKRTNLMFSDEGSLGIDNKDGYRLVPFSSSHIEFYTLLEDGTQMSINNLPLNFNNRIRIPLTINGYKDNEPISGDFTIRLAGQRNLPDDWIVLLRDKETGDIINLTENSEHTFFYGTKAKINSNTSSSPKKMKITNKSESQATRFELQISTEEIEATIPQSSFLNQNYPNPFNPETVIPFGISEQSEVSLIVYNVLGQKIKTLVNQSLAAGTYDITFQANDLATGVYFYRLITNEGTFVKKLTFIK